MTTDYSKYTAEGLANHYIGLLASVNRTSLERFNIEQDEINSYVKSQSDLFKEIFSARVQARIPNDDEVTTPTGNDTSLTSRLRSDGE